jgi:activator of 2-hydroxyglutaryl-CoA dehydratase
MTNFYQINKELLNVDPKATPKNVHAQALDIKGELEQADQNINIIMMHQPTDQQVSDLAAYGCKVALLGGELSLMMAVRDLLISDGYRCFTATTEKVSTEVVNEDGSVTKQSRFNYCQMRELV